MLINASRARANHIREYASTHITTIDNLAIRYSLSPHTIRAILYGRRCRTSDTIRINLRNNRICHRAIIITTLRACGVQYKDIERYLKISSDDQIIRALKIDVPKDFNIIPTITIYLSNSIKDIEDNIIRSGKYVVRPVDNQYNELILANNNSSHIVKSLNLIGKIDINTNE